VSGTDFNNAVARLSEGQRERALQLKARIEALEVELRSMLGMQQASNGAVDLPPRGIDKLQAADLRSRLKAFAEDWDRPEASIYDEDPAR